MPLPNFEIADWLRVNGEVIYGTRPWTVAREGDIRFTRNKANTILYASERLIWS